MQMDTHSEEFKIAVELKNEDFKYFAYHYNKLKFILLTVLYFILINVNLFFLSLSGISDILLRVGISLLVSIITSLFVALILFGTTSWKSGKIYNSDKIKKQKQTYIFKEDGLYLSSETNKGMIKWTEVFKVEEGKKGFYIFISKGRAFIIPKRVFKDDVEVDKFKNILRGYVKAGRVSF